MLKGFYEPEKNQKSTRTFDAKFQEHDQSVALNPQKTFSILW